MNQRSLYRIAALGPLLGLAIAALLRGGAGAELPAGWSWVYPTSLTRGFIAYGAMLVWLWLETRKRTVESLRRLLWWVPPLYVAVSALLLVGLALLQGRADELWPAHAGAILQRSAVHLAVGYGYVLLVHLALGAMRRRGNVAGALALAAIFAAPHAAAQTVTVQEAAAGVLVFSGPGGNAIAGVGPDGAVVAGVQTPATTAIIEAELARRTRSPRRFVVLAPTDAGNAAGDAGWGALGAVVVAHEWTRPRLEQGAPEGPRTALPPVTYSEVIAFDLNGESVHVVHMPPGYTDDDAIVHFHHANIVHLGGSLTTDGYPLVDLGRNGSIDGIIETVSRFVDSPDDSRFVPRRGPVIRTTELREYHRMLTEVRERVRGLARSGGTEEDAVAARPTAAFDARWGRGPVTPEQFVRMVYRSKPVS